jgi:hypothetical protein
MACISAKHVFPLQHGTNGPPPIYTWCFKHVHIFITLINFKHIYIYIYIFLLLSLILKHRMYMGGGPILPCCKGKICFALIINIYL